MSSCGVTEIVVVLLRDQLTEPASSPTWHWSHGQLMSVHEHALLVWFHRLVLQQDLVVC